MACRATFANVLHLVLTATAMVLIGVALLSPWTLRVTEGETSFTCLVVCLSWKCFASTMQIGTLLAAGCVLLSVFIFELVRACSSSRAQKWKDTCSWAVGNGTSLAGVLCFIAWVHYALIVDLEWDKFALGFYVTIGAGVFCHVATFAYWRLSQSNDFVFIDEILLANDYDYQKHDYEHSQLMSDGHVQYANVQPAVTAA